jgi:hypothetical protein
MAAKVGDRLENLTFLRPDGSELRLSDVSAQALVVIFLRHLA